MYYLPTFELLVLRINIIVQYFFLKFAETSETDRSTWLMYMDASLSDESIDLKK